MVVESILRFEGGGDIEEGERGRFGVGDVAMTRAVLCQLLAPKPVHRDNARLKHAVAKISRVRFQNSTEHRAASGALKCFRDYNSVA